MKRRNEGFTLVEMLCTVVILLLVSATVTVGTRLAVESYHGLRIPDTVHHGAGCRR